MSDDRYATMLAAVRKLECHLAAPEPGLFTWQEALRDALKVLQDASPYQIPERKSVQDAVGVPPRDPNKKMELAGIAAFSASKTLGESIAAMWQAMYDAAEAKCQMQNAERYLWCKRAAPDTLCGIAYRATTACFFDTPDEAIDAARQELPNGN